MSSLSSEKCTTCNADTPALTEAEAQALAHELPGWQLSIEPPRLAKEFRFRDFKAAMRFVNQVAELAEAQGHHPDMHVHWNKVLLVLWTHVAAGLTRNDFILGAQIDALKH